MNERVRELRKTLGLTLEKFGKQLGVGKTAIFKLEKGENNVTPQMAKSICREFNVSYLWLTQGEGPMRIEVSKNTEIFQCVQDMLNDHDSKAAAFFKGAITAYYSKFNDTSRQIFDQMLDDLLSSVNNQLYNNSEES